MKSAVKVLKKQTKEFDIDKVEVCLILFKSFISSGSSR